ncbi:hypothetical protein BDF20DRAFT_891980 [Mycotypha africana]|uniref:uncharacterized protein n=1 Tax=Mycotypha africana TaxID=64632 RepID=UPI00230031DA|nr:uncharacterized protein BDF20DRAFT_891980 [Mycotypha africana]KAI8968882.1 hypothetical protein BDF20DRAFT_891980 [Mycotypha africana]
MKVYRIFISIVVCGVKVVSAVHKAEHQEFLCLSGVSISDSLQHICYWLISARIFIFNFFRGKGSRLGKVCLLGRNYTHSRTWKGQQMISGFVQFESCRTYFPYEIQIQELCLAFQFILICNTSMCF